LNTYPWIVPYDYSSPAFGLSPLNGNSEIIWIQAKCLSAEDDFLESVERTKIASLQIQAEDQLLQMNWN
jgi:hypothetical protein